MRVDYTITGAEPDEIWPLVRDHHYSGRMPANIQHCYAIRRPGGLFGDSGEPIAGIIYSIPPTRWSENSLVELSRIVRHPSCAIPLTKLISFTFPWLKRAGWALAVSFADWTQKHHGGIYQAGGWLYGGLRERRMDGLLIGGKFLSGRTCNHVYGTRSPSKILERLPEADIEPHYDEGKHLYWRPVAVAGRAKAKRLGLKSLPYPKPNAAGLVDEPPPGGVSPEHTGEAAPCALTSKEQE
jgi:hypothetical protein